MPLLNILAVSIVTILGGLLAAVLMACFAWRVHHRGWGWALLLGMIGGAWFAALGHSEFFKMAAIFALVTSAGLYFAAHATPEKRQ